MKRLLLNVCFVLLAVFSGIKSFMVKYEVIEKQEKLKEIYHQILDDKREIHMLQAEWMYLNDPQRLKKLVSAQTELQSFSRNQIISLSELPDIPPPVPDQKPLSGLISETKDDHVVP